MNIFSISFSLEKSDVFFSFVIRTGVLNWKRYFRLKGKENLISLLLTEKSLKTGCSSGMVSEQMSSIVLQCDISGSVFSKFYPQKSFEFSVASVT